jgi:hypothetical protein
MALIRLKDGGPLSKAGIYAIMNIFSHVCNIED